MWLRKRNSSVEWINSCKKLTRWERLCNIVVCTEHKSCYLVHFLSFCRKHNNSDSAVAVSQLLTNLKTVNTRHHNIKNRNIKISVVFFIFLQSRFAAVCLNYIVACPCKIDNDKVTNCRFILTNKNFFHIKTSVAVIRFPTDQVWKNLSWFRHHLAKSVCRDLYY